MKRFNTEKELINAIPEGRFYKDYIKERISNWLECEGSDHVENENAEPSYAFTIEIEEKKYQIGVTHLTLKEEDEEAEENAEYQYFYWLEEI